MGAAITILSGASLKVKFFIQIYCEYPGTTMKRGVDVMGRCVDVCNLRFAIRVIRMGEWNATGRLLSEWVAGLTKEEPLIMSFDT